MVVGDLASVVFRNSINATGGAPAFSGEVHIVSFATTATSCLLYVGATYVRKL